jgi:hypothetical protein
MTRHIRPVQRENLGEELRKEYEKYQKGIYISEYNKIKDQCREAANKGRTHLELESWLGNALKKFFQQDGIFITEWKSLSKCNCDWSEVCRCPPQKLTILEWLESPEDREFFVYNNHKFIKRE